MVKDNLAGLKVTLGILSISSWALIWKVHVRGLFVCYTENNWRKSNERMDLLFYFYALRTPCRQARSQVFLQGGAGP